MDGTGPQEPDRGDPTPTTKAPGTVAGYGRLCKTSEDQENVGAPIAYREDIGHWARRGARHKRAITKGQQRRGSWQKSRRNGGLNHPG